MSPDAGEAGSLGARRRAALALHALHPEDRRLVLDALPLRHSDGLRPLLEELSALGIPADRDLLPMPSAGDGVKRGESPLPQHPLPSAPDLRDLAAVLAAEPPAVGRTLLACEPWPWAAPLARLGRDPRRFHATDGPVAPALAQALCAAVAGELAVLATAGHRNGPAIVLLSRLRALARRLR